MATNKARCDMYRNHEPHEQGVWFDYTGFRYKDYYDIELHDGTIIQECRPNGNSWYGNANGVNDSEVKRIRLKPDSELDSTWYLVGQERIDHQLSLFGPPDREKGPNKAARMKIDKPWSEYPIGTKAHAVMGGYWIKTERGWKWCTGATFPTPGGDAIRVELPTSNSICNKG